MSNRKRIVLIGAGSAVFTQGLIADFIKAEDRLGSWEIALVDINKETLGYIDKLAKKMIKEKGSDLKIISTTDRREVLPEADVITTTIAVGGRRAWENDVFIPRKYDIYQPVGDTTMPGGISRALRMIPVMFDITKDIMELCPDAYFFNYSNPMSAIVKAIRKELDYPVIGLCHGLIHVEKYLADFLGGYNVKDIKTIGAGINHLTFIYDLSIKGKDGFEVVDEVLEKQKDRLADSSLEGDYFNPTMVESEDRRGKEKLYIDNPFTWQMYEKYRAIPAVLDRHITEFFPERFPEGEYYGRKLGIDAFRFEDVIKRGDNTFNKMKKRALGEEDLDESLFGRSTGEHEQLIEMLSSLYFDERKSFYVNTQNDGAVSNLPDDAVIELPAVATSQGFYPYSINDFPEVLASIIKRRLAVIDLTVEAALKGDKKLVKEAMLLDGSVSNDKVAEDLTNDLLEAHKEHLPQFN